MKRSLCHNDEDIITCESKADVSPFDYFSMVDKDGKIWWFDQRTMVEWSQSAPQIRNPFTRTELSVEDATRLRNLYVIRKKYGLPLTHSETKMASLEKTRDLRWMRVVQILHECGFQDAIHHEHFVSLRYSELKRMLASLVEDTRWWMYSTVGDKDPYVLTAKRAKFHVWTRSIMMSCSSYSSLSHLSRDVAGLLLACLNDIRDPKDLSFFVMSAYTKTVSGL